MTRALSLLHARRSLAIVSGEHGRLATRTRTRRELRCWRAAALQCAVLSSSGRRARQRVVLSRWRRKAAAACASRLDRGRALLPRPPSAHELARGACARCVAIWRGASDELRGRSDAGAEVR